MSVSGLDRLRSGGLLVQVFGPVRRERHDHVRAGAGQGALLGQVDVQVFAAQALPLGQVLETTELGGLLQAAADPAFPAQHRQLTGQTALRQFREPRCPFAADFPAFDQAFVLIVPKFVASQP
ncbi:hypothetical protein JZ00_29220 [Pseudomonas frederiksbergensis]|uniref:Uncharacterized protein n=1 Tax=Pseudomonas frederiksbergensis TaxID=104087 RepID=A0A0B1YS60_9PSED|nr:hypothetical protein JZ00_29220 [Pseudomonas frederiksbergensis]